MVLRLTEYVIFFLDGSSVGLSPFGIIIDGLVRSKAIVKCPFVASRLVHHFETSRVVGDIHVSAATIISVVNWLRVNLGHVGRGLFLGYHERTFLIQIK